MFKPRLKGQRRDPRLFPKALIFESLRADGSVVEYGPDTVIGSLKILGTHDGFDSGGLGCVFEDLAVTLLSGRVVPAYRRSSKDGNYAICQNYELKAL